METLTLLAGPNNSGKSTLLQALMVWNLAMQKWWEKKGPDSGSKSRDRTGVPVTRQEFTALPLPSMDQLWTDTHTSLRKDEGKQGAPRPIVITMHGREANGQEWKFGFEFRYSGPEQIHVKPVAEDLVNLTVAKNEVSVVYVPPFSGIGVNETRHDRPYQDMLIGQGKAGDILRNLLLARPSSLILLDEPDAHLHVLLQKELYDILRRMCHESGGQLVIATHSEVLIDSTSPRQILSFYSDPRPLASDVDRDQLREALKRVNSLELLLLENAPGILYVDGSTDFDLLKAWANVLDHPVKHWFSHLPFWQNNKGCSPKEARAHFFALKAIKPGIRGVLLLDGDNRTMPDRELAADALDLLRWERYEAESYLLHPQSLERFLAGHLGELFAKPALDYLREEMPPAFFTNPLESSNFLKAEPASKTLLPKLFQRAGIKLPKSDYFLIAQQMQPDEIPAEVSEKLDRIRRVVEANAGD